MAPDLITEFFKQAILISLLMIAVLVLPGLLVGLTIAVIQAATQINEMSLTVVPKIIVTFLALILSGSWLLSILVDYTEKLFKELPFLIG